MSNTDTVQTTVGVVVAAFVGTLNFVGLSNSEVPTILRNQGDTPSFLIVMLAVALLAALGGAFLNSAKKVSVWQTVGVAALLSSAISWSYHIVVVPGSDSSLTDGVTLWISISFLVASAAIFVLTLGCAATVSAKAVLIVAAAILTLTSSYMGIRLETRSQLSATRVELSADVSETSSIASVSVTVNADRLRAVDQLGVLIFALPTTKKLAAYCAHHPDIGVSVPCLVDPCYYLSLPEKYNQTSLTPGKCVQIEGGVLYPDSAGNVQRTIKVPFSDRQYQHLQIAGKICRVPDFSSMATASDTSDGRPPSSSNCTFDKSADTRIDFDVPPFK